MSQTRQQRPLRALTAAACFTAGVLFAGTVMPRDAVSVVDAAAMFPLQKKGQSPAPTTPGQQRNKMIEHLEGIEKRMGSVESLLSDMKSSMGSKSDEEESQ